jgi:uncharacterized protein YcfL
MKKMIFSLAVILMLASCGSTPETTTVDSVQVAVDTTEVIADSAQLDEAAGATESAHEIPVK